MVIDTIPESIPRGAVRAILRELGIDPKWCMSLELVPDGIYAEMAVKGEDGKKVIDGDGLATHKVFIKIK